MRGRSVEDTKRAKIPVPCATLPVFVSLFLLIARRTGGPKKKKKKHERSPARGGCDAEEGVEEGEKDKEEEQTMVGRGRRRDARKRNEKRETKRGNIRLPTGFVVLLDERVTKTTRRPSKEERE